MADCEHCAALQRQNDILANDRDGYVQLLTDDNNKLRAEVTWHVEDKNAWQDTQAAHLREVTRLTARVAKLEGVLKPFADESLWSGPHHEFVTVKRSDCDRARAALSASQPAPQETRDEC